MKQIIITVDKEGKATVEGVGFTGRTCDEKMAAFEKGLGTTTSKKLKPEYSQAVSNAAKQKAGA